MSAGCSFCRYFRHGGARGGLIDDGFAGGVGGDEGLEGEVVDGAGGAAGSGVDEWISATASSERSASLRWWVM